MNDASELLEIKGVGEKTVRLFHKLNIRTAGELLRCVPVRYEEFREPVAVQELVCGEQCAVRACLYTSMTGRKAGNLSILTLTVRDATGALPMTFFNMPYVKNMIKKGVYYIFRGVPRMRNGRMVMEQAAIYRPEAYEKLTGVLQPVYPLTAGLTSHTVAKAVERVLADYRFGEDYLPEEIRRAKKLIPQETALREIHFPPDYDRMLKARERLSFDEFFLFLLGLRKSREHTVVLKNTNPMLEVADTERLTEALPYRLTKAQVKVWGEIRKDLSGEGVMNRLVQGDVGSGKTVLAFLALLMCAANGYQGAMMAPTEVLARQHYIFALEITKAYGLKFTPVLLTGSMTAKEKQEARNRIRTGEANLILGTHALIQEKVDYRRLALVVTDEQHRFGVRQREAFAGKGENVHVMVMSATPIPRTLAIILYGDLDISVLDELPENRLPVKNCVIGTQDREKAYRFMEKEIRAGRQVYVICPMVEEGENDGTENVTDYAQKLKSILPKEMQVAYLHGRMRPQDKNRIMEEFAAHNIDVLVSTTVIEVGINVPNATVMAVENAERFGLAQLHQLRGRVGRGRWQSYCIFISGSDKKQTLERLEILNHSNDGFFIAGEDLKRRGPGDLFGIRQSGSMNFKVGDIYQDVTVLKEAEQCVQELLMQDGELTRPEHLALRKQLENALNLVDFRTI